MNHKHTKILAEFWAHPIPGNIAYKDALSVLKEAGATIEERDGAKVAAHLNGHTLFLHHADHSLTKDTVVQVRKFFEQCGIAKPERSS
ncbi:MAG: hypothetical protein U0575_01465 [Phycisphaerales bacterium]